MTQGQILESLDRQGSGPLEFCENGYYMGSIDNGVVNVWDLRNTVRVIGSLGDGVESFNFDGSGQWLVTGDNKGKVKVYGVKDW